MKEILKIEKYDRDKTVTFFVDGENIIIKGVDASGNVYKTKISKDLFLESMIEADNLPIKNKLIRSCGELILTPFFRIELRSGNMEPGYSVWIKLRKWDFNELIEKIKEFK